MHCQQHACAFLLAAWTGLARRRNILSLEERLGRARKIHTHTHIYICMDIVSHLYRYRAASAMGARAIRNRSLTYCFELRRSERPCFHLSVFTITPGCAHHYAPFNRLYVLSVGSSRWGKARPQGATWRLVEKVYQVLDRVQQANFRILA